jgi:hypothetical protein
MTLSAAAPAIGSAQTQGAASPVSPPHHRRHDFDRAIQSATNGQTAAGSAGTPSVGQSLSSDLLSQIASFVGLGAGSLIPGG